MFRSNSVNSVVLSFQLLRRKKIYIPLSILNSNDVVMSRENQNFYLCLFAKGEALHPR
jgi:hypothetical protein